MLRIISCHQATLLLEQRADQALPPVDRRSLWLHLRYCPYCSRYARQTVLLAELARAAAVARPELPGLSAEARQRLQERLREAGLDGPR
ncbi:anti-sigma factor family protein [Hymenobacter chitinivorans]|uniref:Uncharacterized protein n=1 Tax=Hymenobacter chitinivorans DSM 11115 TaxID=1121954 RepID=A0A2M9AQY4_9BACT|nr:hypothetical protein [Hymenobacter chitinivorans]PJJ48102.1 hypothetical protein CLV45_4795 [Hymenobacter chitinivorans DSM 11115]